MSDGACASDPDVQWRFEQTPATSGANPNSARNVAVFVVHGIGLQAYAETAVTLRCGFEDAANHVAAGKTVFTPYILDGYWADYDDFAKTFKAEYKRMSPGEQTFFCSLWKKRGASASATFAWFFGQSLRLILGPRTVWKIIKGKTLYDLSGLLRWISYWGVAATLWAGLLVLFVFFRKVLSQVLGDVRLYVAPRGQVERAMKQRIDRRVAKAFLKLLGLDLELKPLRDKQLKISGVSHAFTHVTWVAHSLGTVISYNVIGSLWALCDCKEKEAASLSEADKAEMLANVNRVRDGLHRFYTLGSPLEKIGFLFPEALCQWPQSERDRINRASSRRHWWCNFFHVWDPVSGRMRNTDFFPAVKNRHSRLCRWPLWAHVAYWRDKKILRYIISRAYGKELLDFGKVSFLSAPSIWLARTVTLGIMLALTGGIFFLLGWAVSHPGEAWNILTSFAQQVSKLLVEKFL